MKISEKRKKTTTSSTVNRLKLQRRRYVKQGDKDYALARAHILFLTGDTQTEKKKKKNFCARLASLFPSSYRLFEYVDVWMKRKNTSEVEKEERKERKISKKHFFIIG